MIFAAWACQNQTDSGSLTDVENITRVEEPVQAERLTNDFDVTTELVGTKWKLVGIVDDETNSLKVLEPKDCDNCYTITFNSVYSDCNIMFYSSINELTGSYIINDGTQEINILIKGGTKAGEIGDGDLWRNIFPNVKSFFYKENELRLYYNDQKNHLFFKMIEL